jgi:hypothetical protein
VRKNRHPRARVRTDTVHLPTRAIPHPTTGFTHPTPFAASPDPDLYGLYDPAGYGYPDPMLYPPHVEPEPDPPRRWPWMVLGLAALAVVGVLCWLIAKNAALFAVVTAITIIIVCGGGQEVARRRREDW